MIMVTFILKSTQQKQQNIFFFIHIVIDIAQKQCFSWLCQHSVTKYNSIVLQVYMLYVHIFLKTNSKVYFVMHALHFMLLKELFNQCSCQTYLSPNLVISVRLPIVSGISGISLCWRSSDVIWTQFPISAHSKDTVSKEVRLLSNKLAGTVLSAYQQYISAPFDLHFSMLSCTITIFSWLTSQ